ncbi:MAG: MauE/DoxX family redox-associated membrane protein, partial [Deltaproteobacteria bacterium]
AVIFLWSGAAKLLDPQSFATILDGYGILPDGLIGFFAIGLPALELVAALGLLLDIHGCLAIIAALLALFMAVLGYGIWLGLDIDCGCFGSDDAEAKAYHGLRPALYRDLFMSGGVIYLYFWRYRRRAEPIRLGNFINACRRKNS